MRPHHGERVSQPIARREAGPRGLLEMRAAQAGDVEFELHVSTVRYASSMFDAALSTGDVAPSLSEARRCLASSLREVEELSRLLLGAGDAKAALTVAKDMRACSEQLVRGIAASGELLRSDELVGANREQLRAGLGAGIVSRSGVVADTFGDEFRAEFKDADDIARGESQSCCGAARSVSGPTHVSTPTCTQSFGRVVRRSPRAASRTSAGAEPS